MACILLWSSAVRVHDLQAYRKMDVTRERISHQSVHCSIQRVLTRIKVPFDCTGLVKGYVSIAVYAGSAQG